MALPTAPPPVIQQGWLRALLLFLAYYGGLLLAGQVAQRVGNTAIDPFFTAIAIGALVALIITVAFCRLIDRQPFQHLGWRLQGAAKEAGAGFCLAGSLLGIGSLLLFAHRNITWTAFVPDAGVLAKSLVLMLLVALGEEMVFRGYILGNLLQSMERRQAVLLSAVLFALLHLGNEGITLISLLNLLLGGLLLGLTYTYTHNLWFAVAFHFSWNFLQGPILGYAVSGTHLTSLLQPSFTGPALLTGGAFGFEGSVIDTLLTVAALLLLYRVYEQRYPSAADRKKTATT